MEQRKEYRECCGVTEVVYRRPVEEERMWKWLAWREVREEHHTRWLRIYDPTYTRAHRYNTKCWNNVDRRGSFRFSTY